MPGPAVLLALGALPWLGRKATTRARGATALYLANIHLDSTTVLISQLYFSQSLTSTVHSQPPYSTRGQPDTTNETDGIARNGLNDLLLETTAEGSGYAGSIVLGARV